MSDQGFDLGIAPEFTGDEFNDELAPGAEFVSRSRDPGRCVGPDVTVVSVTPTHVKFRWVSTTLGQEFCLARADLATSNWTPYQREIHG